jgi:putative tryptophan/tyrosine transport system substrate-binding protein
MRRREFLLAGAGAAAWPLAARAQQAEQVWRIGVLLPQPEAIMAGFYDELRQFGFVEGKNLVIDRRGFALGYDRFATVAAELVNANVDAILCGGEGAARAAQAATRVIPILVVTDDIRGTGLVNSLARPEGNITGISILAGDLDGKRLELLIDLVPDVRRVALLSDAQANTPRQLQSLKEAAEARGIELSIHSVTRREDILPAIETAKAEGAAALNVLASPFLHGNANIIIERVSALGLPAVYQWPEIAEQGGLLGYGPRFSEIFRQWARQLVKVFSGTKPAILPVEQPTKFELVLNLTAASRIGLVVPPGFLVRADKVVE